MKRRVLVALTVAAMLTTACHARQVEVRTSPPPQQTQASVQVNNNLAQAVNVYAVMGGNETFLRQVAAKSSATLPVQGLPAGSSVTLKAVTVDGVRTFQRQNVVLNGTYVFPLP
jgi:hypothetical protein